MCKKLMMLAFFCASVFLADLASADGERFCVSSDIPKTQKVYFGNGMLTTHSEASRAKFELQQALAAQLSVDRFATIAFDTAYDPSGGFLEDFFDSAIQRLVSENLATRFWGYVSSSDQMPAWLSDMGRQKMAEHTIALMKATDFLPEHEMQYLEDMMSGKVVTVVAHSKGNININNVYDALRNTAGSPVSGIVSRFPLNVEAVATPASYIITGGYTTLIDDTIINTVRGLSVASGLPASLPPNMVNTVRMPDIWRHSFIDAYMVPGSGSRMKILLFLESIHLNTSLQRPFVPTISDGIFTVAAVWGPDVRSNMDIHVDEPNNIHVTHSNMQGVAGRIDRVDVDGFGPEHYVASCDTLVPGRYRVGINYLDGGIGENAFVKIKAGGETKTYRRNLPKPCGNAGDAAQKSVPIAFVDVAGSKAEGFTFAVRELRGFGGCSTDDVSY